MGSAEKISISIDAEDLAWARSRAKARDKSLSAILAEALRRQRQVEARELLLEELGTADITSNDIAVVLTEWKRKKRGRLRR